MNTFGHIFRVTTFGESHGRGLGAVIDGCPAGLAIDIDFIQKEMARRRPGQSRLVTQRKEGDQVEVYSGIFEGMTTGTPIGLLIQNKDQRSRDYSHIAKQFRPSHADYTFQAKYGHRDYRGGGRSSARETAARVAAGAIAQQLLATQGVRIRSFVSQVGDLKMSKPYRELDLDLIEQNDVRCPDPELAEQMEALILKVRKAGDTVGGCISCVIEGVPPGWGAPVFGKLHAELGGAMLGINACKGFEYGSGFGGVGLLGSQHNDEFYTDESGRVRTRSNNSGGVQGGISNGEDIYFRVAFKPVATIIQDQTSIDESGEEVTVKGKGRHDPCVLPRAVPIVDNMAALVLADLYLRSRSDKL
ncbi:MAG: chorismate synthase [Bacteroidota bacterium]